MNKKERQSARTVAALLSAAGKLFMLKGFEKTSMQEIAELCNVTRGALYHHFASKEGILEAMCAAHYAGQKEHFAPLMRDTAAPAVERLTHFVQSLRDSEAANPSYFNTYLRMHASYDPNTLMLKGRLKQYRKQMYIEYVAPLLQAGLKEGIFEFSVSSEEMAVYLLLIEDYVTEGMAAVLISSSKTKESTLARQMEDMAFAFSRLLGCDIVILRNILNARQGVAHYSRALTEDIS